MPQTEQRRRGRPRPAETIERDEQIYRLLAERSHSRGQLARAVGLSTDLVHLALRRLQRDGRARQCLDGGVIVWSVDDGTPCP